MSAGVALLQCGSENVGLLITLDKCVSSEPEKQMLSCHVSVLEDCGATVMCN